MSSTYMDIEVSLFTPNQCNIEMKLTYTGALTHIDIEIGCLEFAVTSVYESALVCVCVTYKYAA